MRENFRGKPRRLKLEQMHMNVYIFKQVSPLLKGPLQLYATVPFFLLTVLAFRCPLSVYSQIDIGCEIKIVAVFVSAKIHFLGTNPPTQIQEVCQRYLSKTNSHLHQMQATKTISPRRQESRNSAARNERQQDIQQPKA